MNTQTDTDTVKTATRKLPRAHYDALARMAANPQNPLRRLQGGFWVVDPDAQEYLEGEWCCAVTVVQVMARHGLVEFIGNRVAELTPAGIEALRTNVFTPAE